MREIGFTSKVFTPQSIVGQLSGGERQGVAIARAIYNQADLIILDEPTTALSLTETAKVFHFVRQVRASGRSILFIGHNIHHVFDIADRFVVLDRGKVALAGRPSAERRVGRAAHQFHGRRRPSRRAAGLHDRHGARSAMSDMATDGPHGRPAAQMPPRRRVEAPVRPLAAPLRSSTTAPRSARSSCFVVMMAMLHRSPTRRCSRTGSSTAPCSPPCRSRCSSWCRWSSSSPCGEIDLSFPATMGFAAWVFALVVQAGYDPFLGIVAAIADRHGARLLRRLRSSSMPGCRR